MKLLAATSIIFLVLTMSLWIRSYFVGDTFFRSGWDEGRDWTLWTQDELKIGAGGIGLNRIVQAAPTYGGYNGSRTVSFRQTIEDRNRVPRLPAFHQTEKPLAPDFHFRQNDRTHWGFNLDHFVHGVARQTDYSEGYQIIVPLWALTILFSAVPFVVFAVHLRRRNRSKHGHCPTCGYDLRATPERCPECGAIPSAKVVSGGPNKGSCPL